MACRLPKPDPVGDGRKEARRWWWRRSTESLACVNSSRQDDEELTHHFTHHEHIFTSNDVDAPRCLRPELPAVEPLDGILQDKVGFGWGVCLLLDKVCRRSDQHQDSPNWSYDLRIPIKVLLSLSTRRTFPVCHASKMHILDWNRCVQRNKRH